MILAGHHRQLQASEQGQGVAQGRRLFTFRRGETLRDPEWILTTTFPGQGLSYLPLGSKTDYKLEHSLTQLQAQASIP